MVQIVFIEDHDLLQPGCIFLLGQPHEICLSSGDFYKNMDEGEEQVCQMGFPNFNKKYIYDLYFPSNIHSLKSKQGCTVKSPHC